MRTFIAIAIPEEIKKEIIKIQEKLPDFVGKKTEIENLHLTLKFIGEISEEKIARIKKKLSEIKFNKFEIQLDKIGMFSDRIIWLNMQNCGELQKEIDEKLSKFFEKEERFMGHLTIARVKKLENRKEFVEKLKKIKISAMKFEVNSFELMKNILKRPAPVYSVIEKYSLIN